MGDSPERDRMHRLESIRRLHFSGKKFFPRASIHSDECRDRSYQIEQARETAERRANQYYLGYGASHSLALPLHQVGCGTQGSECSSSIGRSAIITLCLYREYSQHTIAKGLAALTPKQTTNGPNLAGAGWIRVSP